MTITDPIVQSTSLLPYRTPAQMSTGGDGAVCETGRRARRRVAPHAVGRR